MSLKIKTHWIDVIIDGWLFPACRKSSLLCLIPGNSKASFTLPNTNRSIITMLKNSDNLPADLYAKVTLECEKGNELLKNKEYRDAEVAFIDALQMLPDPLDEWEATTWIIGSIGEVRFEQKRFEEALQAFTDAVSCPGGLGNPYLHLRLGQCQFEMGNLDKARNELTRAYMGGDTEIFKDEDPKYFDFLKQFIRLAS